MSNIQPNLTVEAGLPDARWKDLYRIGFVACVAFPILIVIAIIAFFIWPYTPGIASMVEIFEMLQTDRLAALISMDLLMVLFMPIMVLQMLALYVALKPVNESYALIALVLGLMANVLLFTARPMAELIYLSDQYFAATSDIARSQYLAAGEALNMLFGGTAWMAWNIFIGLSYLISCVLMLRTRVFSNVTAYVGIVIFVFGLGFMLPEIGPALALVGSMGTVVWFLMLARPFYRLGWSRSSKHTAMSMLGTSAATL